MKQGQKILLQATLLQFTGTECWYPHPLVPKVRYTEGIQYLAEHCGAYWLLDEIAFAQVGEPAVSAEEFQLWRLTVRKNQTAVLSCEDGNLRRVYKKTLDYTDFPLSGILLYFTNGVILLPTEY